MKITNIRLVQNVSDMNYIVEVTIKRFWRAEVKELWSVNRYRSYEGFEFPHRMRDNTIITDYKAVYAFLETGLEEMEIY